MKYPEGPNSHLDSFREEPWGSAEDVMFEQRSEVIRARQSWWSEAVSLFPISPVMRQEGEQSLSAVHHPVKHFPIVSLEGHFVGLLTQCRCSQETWCECRLTFPGI